MKNKPILAIISDDIRRDLQAPLANFQKIEIRHFYRQARYQDMKKEEFANTCQYDNHQDLSKKLAELKPDIIQGPEPFASRTALYNCWVVYDFHKKYQTPYIFPMFENRPAEIKFGPILGFMMKKILKKYADSAFAIINLNQGAKKTLLAVGIPKEKITHLNWGTWGVNSKEFKIKNQKSKIKNEDKKTILFVGKVEEQKGIPDLIKAFKIVRKKYKNIELQIIGSGNLVDEIKKKSGVKYIGIIKNQDIPRYFQNAWVAVTPSVTTKTWEEQVGMVNIQAMACGTPVVSTVSGAIPEYVPNNLAGILVPEHDPRALAQAIMKILTNQNLRNKMGHYAREYAKKHYDSQKNIQIAEKFILNILKNYQRHE